MKHTTSSNSPDENPDQNGASIALGLPVRNGGLFKHSATASILNFLSDNPEIDVSLRQLSRVVPTSQRATREAVDTLETNDLVDTFHQGNARRVHINRARLDKPGDPILSIPQTEFQTPVRVACQYLQDELDAIKGIVLFGSVARGDADRRSDIDLWVLVAGDHMQQRHEANELASHLDDLQIPPTIALADATNADFDQNWDELKTRLEDDQNWVSAQRHSFEIVVETPQSIVSQSNRVDAQQLFGQGITLVSSETLDRVKQEIISDE